MVPCVVVDEGGHLSCILPEAPCAQHPTWAPPAPLGLFRSPKRSVKPRRLGHCSSFLPSSPIFSSPSHPKTGCDRSMAVGERPDEGLLADAKILLQIFYCVTKYVIYVFRMWRKSRPIRPPPRPLRRH